MEAERATLVLLIFEDGDVVRCANLDEAKAIPYSYAEGRIMVEMALVQTTGPPVSGFQYATGSGFSEASNPPETYWNPAILVPAR